MPQMTIERKQLHEIAVEKKFLQMRWQALKKEFPKPQDEDEPTKEEKSYIAYRWKHLSSQEKNLKSILNAKSVKNAPAMTPAESFAKKFKKSGKSLKQAYSFLKNLSELSTIDFKDGHRLQAYHYGRKMDEIIGKMFGDEEEDEDKGKENLAKMLLTTKGLDGWDDVDVTDPSGKLKGAKKEPMQQHTESIVPGGARGSKDFDDKINEATSEVGTTKKQNPSKIAKPAGDKMPFNDGHPGSTEASHLISGVGKKDFDDKINEANRTVDTTKPGGNTTASKIGSEPMQMWGEGGSLVKFFKVVSDAGAYLKTLAYEKAFGEAHREMARSLIKAMEMNKPFAAQQDSEFPGDLANVLQEGDEEAHKGKKKALPPGNDPMMGMMGEEEDPLAGGGMVPGDDLISGGGMDALAGGGMDELGGGLGGGMDDGGMGLGEEEEDPLAGLEGGPMMGTHGMKSLDAMMQNALRQAQAVNDMNKSLNNLMNILN